jgi:AraC-like DNA-binding protein
MEKGQPMTVASRYVAMADAEAFTPAASPFMGLFDERTASLRCFQRYSRNATRDIVDGDGMTRWVSQKQARVQGVIHRLAMSPTGAGTMADIAIEAGCTKSTVSRTIKKLEGWAMYAVEVRRGRYGGITVHRKGWDRFYDYVHEARRKMSDARIRARSKVASIFRRGDGEGSVPSTSLVATLEPGPMSFGQRVLYERAMLALDDPDGEYEAVRPLIHRDDIDNALLLAEDERRRQDNEIREAALQGDWERWGQLRADRWNS